MHVRPPKQMQELRKLWKELYIAKSNVSSREPCHSFANEASRVPTYFKLGCPKQRKNDMKGTDA